jgi:hypothetical protein
MSMPTPELAAALVQILDKIDRSVREGGHTGPPIVMFLAGGLAVNYYCGSRYTGDIDASFSRRVLLSEKELTAAYRRADGKDAILYFDANYNPTFALMHPGFEADSRPWDGIGNEGRSVQLNVLSPLDLAVSKISRSSAQDRRDILDLAGRRLLSAGALRTRAEEALDYYIGDKREVRRNIEEVCFDVARVEAYNAPAPPSAGFGPEP